MEPKKNALLDYESDEHAWLLPLIDRLPQDIKINYDGIGQDVMCGPKFYSSKNSNFQQLLKQRNYEDFIYNYYYLKQYSFLKWSKDRYAFDRVIFSSTVRKRFSTDVFLEKVKEQLVKYENRQNQYIYFHLTTHTRREISLAPFQLILNKAETLCPYYDNDYCDFLLSLPVSAKFDQRLRKQLVDSMQPAFNWEDIFKSEQNNLTHHYPDVERQQLCRISQMEDYLLSSNAMRAFNAAYLLPRFMLDHLFAFIFRHKHSLPREVYKRSHFWLVPPLFFLAQWSHAEGIELG